MNTNTKIKTKGEPHVPKKHTENQMPGLWHRRRIYNMAEYQYEIEPTGEGGSFVWQVICVYLPEMQESPLCQLRTFVSSDGEATDDLLCNLEGR